MPDCIVVRPSSAGLLFSRVEHPCMRLDVEEQRQVPRSAAGAEVAALVEAVAGHDRAAFAELYERTSAKLYGICLRMLRSDSDAQDALQDIYVAVWNKAARFDAAKASAITWLCVLARNKAIDRLRRQPAGSADLDSARDVEDDRPSAFDLIGDAQDADRLGHCLEELEERVRLAIRSAFLDGATYPELAEREKVPLGTMKSWIRRGLQQLRGCLER